MIVSNTSPLTNLAAIGQFDLLRRLHCKIDKESLCVYALELADEIIS